MEAYEGVLRIASAGMGDRRHFAGSRWSCCNHSQRIEAGGGLRKRRGWRSLAGERLRGVARGTAGAVGHEAHC